MEEDRHEWYCGTNNKEDVGVLNGKTLNSSYDKMTNDEKDHGEVQRNNGNNIEKVATNGIDDIVKKKNCYDPLTMEDLLIHEGENHILRREELLRTCIYNVFENNSVLFLYCKYVLLVYGKDLIEEKNIDLLNFQIIKGGITNILVKLQDLTTKNNYLIRLYGPKTSEIINREREKKIATILCGANISKKIYTFFPNGRIEEYMEGYTLTKEDIKNEKYQKKIAERLKLLHNVHISDEIFEQLLNLQQLQGGKNITEKESDKKKEQEKEKEKEREKERRGSILLMEEKKENDAILEKAKNEIEDLEIENDLLKTKIIELEKLNKNVFNDNKELIRIISSFEEKEKNGTLEKSHLRGGIRRGVHVVDQDIEEPNALEKLTLHNSVSRSTYEHLLNEHRIIKHKNENLISEMDHMRNQLNEYKNMVSKHDRVEESNKKTKNYLHYLNDKIKSFIEIFNDKNFNYDYFKKELKKMRSTNLMILEDNFGNEISTIFKRDSEEEKGFSSDLEGSIAVNDLEDENNDSVSVDTRIIVNLFSAYDDNTYGKELIITRKELNQFYKYIVKLKEHYKKKCLVIENQQGKIRALNEEVVAYAEGYKDKEQQWKNKINEILNEQSLHTEKFSKIHNTLIKTLEEEIDRNKKLVKEIDEKNEQLKRKEEHEIRMENLLQLKDADVYNEYSDGDLKHILKVQNKYNQVKEHNAQINQMNEKLLEENQTFKEAVINMKKEIDQLTEEIHEKKILLNKRNSEIEELRRKVEIGFSSKRDSGNTTGRAVEEKGGETNEKDTPQVVKEYEEVILLMEQRNNELEKRCEQMKNINEEMGQKYNNAMKAYNELNETLNKKEAANKEQNKEKGSIDETDSATKIHKMAEYAYEQHIKELRSSLLQKEEEYNRLQNELMNIRNECEKCVKELEQEREGKEQMKKIHKTEYSRMEQMEQSLQKVLSERERTIEDMQQLVEKYQREIQELKDDLNEEKKSKECILKEDSNMYDMLNKEIEFLKNQKTTSGHHIKDLEFEIENLKNDINTVNDLLRDSKEEGHMMKQKLMEKEWIITKMKNRMEEDRREWEQISPSGHNNESSNKTGNGAMDSSRNSQWEMLLQKERERTEECEKEIKELKKKNEVETEEHYKKLKELRMEVKRMNENYNKLKHEMEKKVETYLEEIKELKICKNRMEEENVAKNRKDELIEVAIKEMDHEIETLKVEVDNKNTYIKELQKQIDEGKQEMQFIEENIKEVENFIRNTMESGAEGMQQVEQIHQRMDELFKKIEGLCKVEGKEMKHMYFSLLQSICNILRLWSLVLKDLKKRDEELKEQIRDKEKEMLQLDNTLEQMLHEANERENEINEKKKELNNLNEEIFHKREEVSRVQNILYETQSKEHTRSMQKERELMLSEHELRKTRDEMTHFAEGLKKRKEELVKEKTELEKEKSQIEKQKKELISEYDKLFNAQKDVKIKEDKLKKIYEKIKDQNLIELLDITNEENEGGNDKAGLLDKELSILNSSLSFKKISENAVNDEQINLDSIEYTAYFKEFKKRIKNLKTDLSNKEKDLEILKKTLEIERKEKEIYRMEFEKLEEMLNAEKSNVQKLEEEVTKYKSDDSNIVRALKESEHLVAEKNAEVVELQQKLLECTYEMSLLDKEKKKVESENGELAKEIERLNQIIQESQRNISKLNKEKLHITRKSIEKIMYDGEDIKELKNSLEDANELIRELQGKNIELDKINVELKEANKEMRGDIDVLLVNIEDINDERDRNEKKLKQNEEKYNELKAVYQEKEKELKRIFLMLSEKKKKKIAHEWEKRQATLTSINDTSTGVPYGVQEDTHLHMVQNVSTKNGSVKEKYGESEENHKFNKSSGVSFSEDSVVNEEEKIYQEVLNEKNMIIKSLNEKIDQYDAANAKQQKIIEEYKNIIDKFSNKINVFEENIDVLTRLNEFINDNNCSSDEVMDLLKNGFVYKKILIKILCENPFYKLILLIKGCIEDMAKNEDGLFFSGRESGKMSFLRRATSFQIKNPTEEMDEEEMEMEEENNLFYTNEADRNVLYRMREQIEQYEKDIKNEMIHLDQHCNSFENLCEYLFTCYKQNDFNIINEKINDLELLFKNVIDGFITQMGRVRNKIDCEKGRFKRSIKILKKQIQQLSHDVIKGVEESNERNVILTKEREQIEMLMTENNELRDLYDKLNDDYNEKLMLLQNNEYELNELKEQLLEKDETKEKAEEMNECLKTDINYLNTSLGYATQNISELDSENKKNKKIIEQMEEEQEYMKEELHKKKLIIEELEKKLEENNAVIEELKEINDIVVNKLEVEIERNKEGKKFLDEEETVQREDRNSRKNIKEQQEQEEKKENYNRIMEKELRELIAELKSDNRVLIGELDILKNNFRILQEKKKELEDIISANDIALNKKEIELNDVLIEKEKQLEEIKRYHVKCIQMVTICFNENLQILEIRERIIALWEREENNYVPFNNEVEEKILAILNNYKQRAKGEALLHHDELPSAAKDEILHIDEMSRKNEELIKKNEEIWKLNKYIEELNKTISDRDYTLIKNQQVIENQKDALEENEGYINFLKEQIKVLCNNIDTDNMFNINSVNLTPELRSIIKRKSFLNEQNARNARNARKSRISSGKEAAGTGGEEEASLDEKTEKNFFSNSQKKRISRLSNQMELNFYDEKDVEIEELKLKIYQLTDEFKSAEVELKKLKKENMELIDQCEHLKNVLKESQGVKRDLMLCESKIEILETALKEKTEKLEEQNKTVNECVDVYVEENSEAFHKILELKKENEKYKIEIKIMDDEIRQLQNDILNYKNEIKELNNTLEQYQSTHEQLIGEFSKGESSNLYYIKLCEVLKKENEDYKEYVKMEEEKKRYMLKDIDDVKIQLHNAVKENNEITLDLEFFQAQNTMLQQSCNYYKEREDMFIHLLKEDEHNNVQLIENCDGTTIKNFVQNLKKQINELNQHVEVKSKSIISLKYQLKEYHLLQSSKNNVSNDVDLYDAKELVNINNMAYVQNSLFIYINLFKSVLFIIKEILFFTDSQNSLYSEILKIMQLKTDGETEPEIDSTIKNFHLSKIDKDMIYQVLLKSKPLLREKLQILQLKIQ